MNFDVYFPFENKDGKKLPGVKPNPKSVGDILDISKRASVKELIERYRSGDKDAKLGLPAVDWIGTCTKDRRRACDMIPTQFIMIDIDHVEDPLDADAEIKAKMREKNEPLGLAHITPSGHGLRYIVRAIRPLATVSEQLQALEDEYHFSSYGDFDSVCKDLSRLSFLPQDSDIRFINIDLLSGNVKFDIDPISTPEVTDDSTGEVSSKKASSNSSAPTFTDEEIACFESRTYYGFDYKKIISDYLEVYGQPGSGDIHNYYNEMVKNFRCICDNNKRFLLWLLPKFGHTDDECWSQIVSICRVNTLSRLPKEFYFFLKDRGYYQRRNGKEIDLMTSMLSEDSNSVKFDLPPYLPPVFRELVGIAPHDFIPSCVNALLPIMGTLTSYLRGVYPYDNREHSTSFFSVIYAPAGTGKGFVERYIDLLFEQLKLRDFIQSERENIYLRAMAKKGANDKAPDAPHTSLRIIPPKNSEAEFLQKQRDNNGYHMFTFAAEMDSWAKGVKAAGGNKDDMIRIAWDNGEYGQQFKSFNTFKGMVKLYWNVLITGTLQQVENYFKNVENGLVTRCSFTSIENQEFALPPVWGTLNKKKIEVVKRFCERCDRRSYKDPCNIDVSDLVTISDEDFDKEVDWKFEFRPPMNVDMSWIMPTIDNFHNEQLEKAARDVDRARDVFRRRAAVRGFRLALLCYGLFEQPRPIDLENCCKFVDWWMHLDLECTLKLWGQKYNESTEVVEQVSQQSLYEALGDSFTREDVYTCAVKMGIKTPVRRIIHEWNKIGCISKIDMKHFEKKNVQFKTTKKKSKK